MNSSKLISGLWAQRSTLVFALILAIAPQAWADRLPDLYTAEVPYDASRRDGRELAYKAAMRDVLKRLSPNPQLIDVATALGPVSQYVLGYREASRGKLWVSLDGVVVTSKLRDAGYAVWGNDRPLTLVWLVIDAPDGGRMLVSANASPADEATNGPLVLAPTKDFNAELRAQLSESASRYGVPLSFPLMDEIDAAAVGESDVWGGFDDIILDASRRYGTGSVLLAKADSQRLENIRWTWLFAGDRREFSGSVNVAAARVANALMQELASSPDASENVRIRIDGVDGMVVFGEISRFLTTQNLIEQVDVVAMRGDSVVFEIDSLTTRSRLAQILDGAVLEQIRGTSSSEPIGTTQSQPVIADFGFDPFSSVDLEFRVRVTSGSAL